jgi:hypothetical protein
MAVGDIGAKVADMDAMLRRWTLALDAAVSAVHAGWNARSLSHEVGSSELSRVRSEREWLLLVDWRAIDALTTSSRAARPLRARSGRVRRPPRSRPARRSRD